MEDWKMCFCSNLIKMSLCDAFLEKPRIDSTEDSFRCPFSVEQVHRVILSGWAPPGVAGQSTEDGRQEHCGQHCCCIKQGETVSAPQWGRDTCLARSNSSIYSSLQTTLILGMDSILDTHSPNSSSLQMKKYQSTVQTPQPSLGCPLWEPSHTPQGTHCCSFQTRSF